MRILLEFGNTSPLEEYEDAEEPGPALNERTMTALKLTEGLLLIEADVKVLEDVDSNEQRAEMTRQGIK